MAISSPAEDRHRLPTWARSYARDTTTHVLVILFFLLYPGIHHVVSSAEGTTVAKLLLPTMPTMIQVLIVGLFAASFDFISGYTGYLSFGHSLFFGTGVFFVLGVRAGAFEGIPVLSAIPPGTPFMILLALAVVLAVVLALVVGAFSFRLTGVYFAMITLGVAELAKFTVLSYVGADSGLRGQGPYRVGVPYIDGLSLELGRLGGSELLLHRIPGVDVLLSVLDSTPLVSSYVNAEVVLDPTTTTFYIVGAVVVVCYFIMQRIIHSPFGRVMIAIRENEERVSAIGYNTFRYKMGAFAISAAFGAVAGALKAGVFNNGTPGGDFGVIERTGQALIATIIGGIGTLAGPFYGLLLDLNIREIFGNIGSDGLVSFLREVAQWLLDTELLGISVSEIVSVVLQGRAELYIGLVFILFILFVPGGLLGTLRTALGGTVAKTLPGWVSRRVERVRSVLR